MRMALPRRSRSPRRDKNPTPSLSVLVRRIATLIGGDRASFNADRPFRNHNGSNPVAIGSLRRTAFLCERLVQYDAMCVDGRFLRTFPMSKLGEAEKLMEVLDFFGKIVLVPD
jgi:hypothetical protein